MVEESKEVEQLKDDVDNFIEDIQLEQEEIENVEIVEAIPNKPKSKAEVMAGSLDYAVSLLETKGLTAEDWRTKILGLQLCTLGLAEMQAKRLVSLNTILDSLENRVFSENNLAQTNPSQLINLYRMANEALQRASEYIKQTLSGVDINKLEMQLKTISIRNTSTDPDNNSRVDPAILHALVKQLSNLNRQ